MLISTRSRYALRVLARMVQMASEGPKPLSEIAAKEKVSTRYLEQIFGRLRSTGIVKGKRGPGGGYVLVKPPEDISLFDVVSALETEFLPADCMTSITDYSTGDDGEPVRCKLEATCLTRPLWLQLRNIYFDFMKNRSLADLAYGRIREPGEV